MLAIRLIGLNFLDTFWLSFVSLVLFFTVGKEHLTDDFIIVLEDVPDDFAVGYVEVSLLDSNGLDKSLFARLIVALFLLDLAIGFFEVGQPLSYFLIFQGRTEDIDSRCRDDFESYPYDILSVHCCCT